MIYTEQSLAEYMERVLGQTGAQIGLSAASADFELAVEDAVLTYGSGITIDTAGVIVGATDITKLRALAKVEAWRTAVNATAGDYQYSTDGETRLRQQRHEQCKKLLALAVGEAARYGASGMKVGVWPLVQRQDRYGPRSWTQTPVAYP